MLRADLHLHSTCSDGGDTVAQLAHRAQQAGLDLIAVTDHDTLAAASQAGRYGSVQVITGIEISAFDEQLGTKAHILGYGIRTGDPVRALCTPVLLRRDETCRRQIALLREHGFAIEEDEVHHTEEGHLFKQFLLEYLERTGQIAERYGDFYNRVFRRGGYCCLNTRYVDAAQAVRAVCAAGGLAVLAHPGQQQNFALVERLVQAGLAGLECCHPSNSEEDRALLHRLAERYGLFLTGGSDFHGSYDSRVRPVGSQLSPEDGAFKILQHLQKVF